jgi:signal transduction histidine kinase
VIRNDLGQVIVRPQERPGNRSAPTVTGRKFVSLADGGRLRSITLTFTLSEPEEQPHRQATIIYTAPADALDNLLRRMAIVLGTVAFGGALLIGAVAWQVSKAALSPLRQTADVIGTIDERKLDRRVEAANLPSELRPMAHRLNEMLARLEREFLQRKQFLADTAHELRTPVAAILTQLEVTLRRPRDAATLAEALRNALSEVQMLRRLVDALLEQVRTDHPQVTAQIIRTDISSLLDQCATLADSLASARNVRLVRKVPAGLHGDILPVALQSIVTNLLANAVEYSPPGATVEFTARLADGKLEIDVLDSGPGIPSDVLPNIFQPFYRVNQSRGAGEGHLGLGLFLVQSHARSLGGKCAVESTVGTGTTFHVHIPLPNFTFVLPSTTKIQNNTERSEVIDGSSVVLKS